MGKFVENLIGKRFGRLVVIGMFPRRYGRDKDGK